MSDLLLISVMSLKPDDILVFSTPDKLTQASYNRLEQKIIEWKKGSHIKNKHLILTSSITLKVLQPEKAKP
jgi:hypothetical protein